jgi:hypothetical protein
MLILFGKFVFLNLVKLHSVQLVFFIQFFVIIHITSVFSCPVSFISTMYFFFSMYPNSCAFYFHCVYSI